MTTRPSEALLDWLRRLCDARSLNMAALAKASSLPKARVRKILGGIEPMLVDELLAITEALEITPADMMGVPLDLEALDASAEPAASPKIATIAEEPELPLVDAWGNQPEQLFKIGFALGCDFFFYALISELSDSGVPADVLEKYGDMLPIHLEAAFHRHYAPVYHQDYVQLTLPFDALYKVRIPYASLRRFTFVPLEPIEEEPPPGPTLRLVT